MKSEITFRIHIFT